MGSGFLTIYDQNSDSTATFIVPSSHSQTSAGLNFRDAELVQIKGLWETTKGLDSNGNEISIDTEVLLGYELFGNDGTSGTNGTNGSSGSSGSSGSNGTDGSSGSSGSNGSS